MLDCVSRPFLVALMHFNPVDKLVENGGGKLGKGSMAFQSMLILIVPIAYLSGVLTALSTWDVFPLPQAEPAAAFTPYISRSTSNDCACTFSKPTVGM